MSALWGRMSRLLRLAAGQEDDEFLYDTFPQLPLGTATFLISDRRGWMPTVCYL